MTRRGAKLKDALRRHQGKDIKLELQRKSAKEAEKKRNSKRDNPQEDQYKADEEDEAGGVPLSGDFEDFDSESEEQSGESEGWETDEDEEEDEEQIFDLSRLDDTDSESEIEGEDEEEENTEAANKRVSALKSKIASIVSGNKHSAALTATEPTEDEDEDIPLSDLSDADDTEDIIPHQRLTINNHPALQRALASFALPFAQLPFSEHQSITTKESVNIADVEDELNRELSFYSQALSSASEARSLLRKEGVPFTRPNDFFAEMVKSDEHMGKIKAKLVGEAAGKKAAQDARKQRDLKKFGKQVQQEKLKERAKDKREMLDRVKLLKRKRQSSGPEAANEDDMFDVALEDAASSEQKSRGEKRARKDAPRGANGQMSAKNAKRQQRDEKFGFGGKKKHKKSGDAFSSADMKDYSTKRMKGGGARKPGAQRPGKSRRAKMK